MLFLNRKSDSGLAPVAGHRAVGPITSGRPCPQPRHGSVDDTLVDPHEEPGITFAARSRKASLSRASRSEELLDELVPAMEDRGYVTGAVKAMGG